VPAPSATRWGWEPAALDARGRWRCGRLRARSGGPRPAISPSACWGGMHGLEVEDLMDGEFRTPRRTDWGRRGLNPPFHAGLAPGELERFMARPPFARLMRVIERSFTGRRSPNVLALLSGGRGGKIASPSSKRVSSGFFDILRRQGESENSRPAHFIRPNPGLSRGAAARTQTTRSACAFEGRPFCRPVYVAPIFRA